MGAGVDLYVQVKVKVTDAPPVTKNLNKNRYAKIRTVDAQMEQNVPWSLGLTDVQSIQAVYTLPMEIVRVDILMTMMIQ